MLETMVINHDSVTHMETESLIVRLQNGKTLHIKCSDGKDNCVEVMVSRGHLDVDFTVDRKDVIRLITEKD